jgi:hypothetical protein
MLAAKRRRSGIETCVDYAATLADCGRPAPVTPAQFVPYQEIWTALGQSDPAGLQACV